ncbi:MAG TPA: MetQ/NlpA family ABC transporter substrate-binding protein [Pseudonocardia sp.]|jgi:D-methionine transport system substrate-binding protein|uniref:MetQ/NlpA family ABC transporter substrate-binding protein n=1 Tax=Pseudonocardia sp. TaxID=60912 RepID=UPI002B4ADE92|nr:MetQ/NlpA family ABC transporter substrate-binding protein [Pseudonocardia sp.]HLU55951.1 MetQ/NlpA family ABC transporter substrate-binding protein [Pseudonocardia sp.]
MRLRSAVVSAVAALTAIVTLAACGGSASEAAAPGDPAAPLRVGVSPTPHGEILRYVADELAPARNLQIEIVEFTDYVQPNTALVDGSLDANYFQTVPYLEEFTASSGADLAWIAPVHVEPLGLYSNTVTDIAALPDGATIGIANDATNEARGLRLLAANGLITLNPGTEATATPRDIASNPKNLQFSELEAAQLPRSLEDTDASVVNGNYAIDAGLNPATDALVLESAENNPNANGLVTRTELRDDPRIATLAELLQSQEVKTYIEQNYSGAVIPV